MKIQTWFTLYFIPVFPTKTHGEHIVCDGCNNAFNFDVLNYDPAAAEETQKQQLANKWRSVLLSVACASGAPTTEQAERIRESLATHWQMSSQISEIIEDCGHPSATGIDESGITDAVRDLAPRLGTLGKEHFLQSALMVLQAKPMVGQNYEQLFAAMGNALGLSEAHVRGIFAGQPAIEATPATIPA